MYSDITYLVRQFRIEHNEYPNMVIIPEDYPTEESHNYFRMKEYINPYIRTSEESLEKTNFREITLRIIRCKHIDDAMVMKEV